MSINPTLLIVEDEPSEVDEFGNIKFKIKYFVFFYFFNFKISFFYFFFQKIGRIKLENSNESNTKYSEIVAKSNDNNISEESKIQNVSKQQEQQSNHQPVCILFILFYSRVFIYLFIK